MHVIERSITVHYEDSDKGTVFTDSSSVDILYYSEECDKKGELIKAGHGHYMLLRRATLLSQPENEKVHSLGDYVAVCSETNDWYICVISEINDPSKEAKVRFMRKSGQYFLLSKSWKSGSQSQQYFTDASYHHPLTIACILPLMLDFKMDLHICKSQLK